MSLQEDKIIPPIKEAIVSDFISKHFPEYKNEKIEYKGGGSFSVFSIGTEYIFRFSKSSPDQAVALKRSFELENSILKQIRPLLKPHEIAYHQQFIIDPKLFPSGVWLTKKFHGHLLSQYINEATSYKVASLLGQFLGLLHQIIPGSISGIEWNSKSIMDVRQSWHDNYVSNKKENFPYLSPSEQRYMECVFEEFLSFTNGMIPVQCLTHGDFDPFNCLISPNLNHLQVIDWEDICFGFAAGDFCTWYGHFGPDFLDKMLASYPIEVDDHFKKRVRFFWLRIPLLYIHFSRIYNNSKFLDFGKQLLVKNMKRFSFG